MTTGTKEKLCKQCGSKQPRDNFYRLVGPQYKDTWDCRDSLCIPCRTIYATLRRRSTKKLAIDYLGGKCSDCGLVSDVSAIYEFHHKEPDGKDFSIGNKSNVTFLSLKRELDKCVLLCANCHRLRHYREESEYL